MTLKIQHLKLIKWSRVMIPVKVYMHWSLSPSKSVLNWLIFCVMYPDIFDISISNFCLSSWCSLFTLFNKTETSVFKFSTTMSNSCEIWFNCDSALASFCLKSKATCIELFLMSSLISSKCAFMNKASDSIFEREAKLNDNLWTSLNLFVGTYGISTFFSLIHA